MGKFDGYLICTDCDGTLTDSHRRLSAENADAIRYFQQEGGLFTVSSGRYPHYIQEFAADFVPNTYVIGCNGAVLFDLKKDEVVHHMPIKAALNEMLTDIYENMPWIKSVVISGKTDQFYHYIPTRNETPEWLKNTDSLEENIVFVSNTEEIDRLLADAPGDIVRLLFVHESEEDNLKSREILGAKYSDKFRFVMSWDKGLEVLDVNCGKGEMINYMKSIMPRIHTTVGVGDYENDISMLELCDIGYAVDNAPDFIKSHADRITVSCDESAIAHIISDIEEQNS